jgi:transposase
MLWKQLEENDDATLVRHCGPWEKGHGVRVSISAMSRAVRRLGWTFKKVAGSLRARRREKRYLARACEGPRPDEAGVFKD